MAATKTKGKKSSKTSKTKTSARKTTGAKKPRITQTTKATKTSKKTTTKRTTATKKTQGVVGKFLVDVVKQANKVQKKTQAETKVWIKKLNTQDKQLSQLTKKTAKAKGSTKRSLDKRIAKLQGQMSETRTGLLAAENAGDKIATFIDWVTQLNAKPSSTAYLQTSAQSASRPTLVTATQSRSRAEFSPSYEEEDTTEREQEINFLFGEDEDEEEVNR